MVDAASGIKIAVHSPEQAIRDLRTAFAGLRDQPGMGASLANAAVERVGSHFTWDAKEKTLRTTYKRLTGH
jgi:plasmid stabilization system protein ParE